MKKAGFLEKKYNAMLIASLLGWAVTIVGDLSDSLFAGLFISEEAVAAVELVSPIFSLLLFVSYITAIGSSVVYSGFAGAFDTDKAYKTCGTALISAVAESIILTSLMILLENTYFSFYSVSAEIEAYAREYYECFFVLAFIYPLYWTFYNLVCCDGDEVIILISDILNAFGNFGLSILLVNAWGIRGLAWGTILAAILSGIPLVFHFLKKSNSIKFKIVFKPDIFKKICITGSSTSLTCLYVAITDIIINKFIIIRFGSEYLPAYTIINLALNLSCSFSCAVTAASPFISINYGEENPVGIKKIMNIVTKDTLILGAFYTIVIELTATTIPRLYGISNPEVFECAVMAGRVIALAYIPTSLVYELSNYYSRTEKALIANLISSIYMLIAPIVIPVALSYSFGFSGFSIGFALTPIIALIYAFIHISIKYGIKKFPFVYQETDKKIFIYETVIAEKDITDLAAQIEIDLQSIGVDPQIINKAALMVEETFMIVKDKNQEKKILADCTIMVSDSKVELITRDNGVIFDITTINSDLQSLRQYVAERLMTDNDKNIYLTTTSFNRNVYVWNLNE